MPVAISVRFKSYNDLKYYTLLDGKVKKRTRAQLMQAKDMMVDQFRQIEQVLAENDVDMLRVEGNLGGEDLIEK